MEKFSTIKKHIDSKEYNNALDALKDIRNEQNSKIEKARYKYYEGLIYFELNQDGNAIKSLMKSTSLKMHFKERGLALSLLGPVLLGSIDRIQKLIKKIKI